LDLRAAKPTARSKVAEIASGHSENPVPAKILFVSSSQASENQAAYFHCSKGRNREEFFHK
jgi:hypothetical protein